jgi:hypothetical protein
MSTVCILISLFQGKPNGKKGSFVWSAFYLDPPMMLVNNAMGNREAKANAPLPGGEEGIEKFIDVVRRDADPGVLDGKLDPLIPLRYLATQLKPPTFGHGLDGIQQKVESHLLHLFLVNGDRGQGSEMFLNRNPLLLDLGPEQLERLFKNSGDFRLL